MSTTDRSRRGSVASPVPAAKALETYFLEARSKLLGWRGNGRRCGHESPRLGGAPSVASGFAERQSSQATYPRLS